MNRFISSRSLNFGAFPPHTLGSHLSGESVLGPMTIAVKKPSSSTMSKMPWPRRRSQSDRVSKSFSENASGLMERAKQRDRGKVGPACRHDSHNSRDSATPREIRRRRRRCSDEIKPEGGRPGSPAVSCRNEKNLNDTGVSSTYDVKRDRSATMTVGGNPRADLTKRKS